jgi:hypothetical protein
MVLRLAVLKTDMSRASRFGKGNWQEQAISGAWFVRDNNPLNSNSCLGTEEKLIGTMPNFPGWLYCTDMVVINKLNQS